jgi:outer membrane protein W
MKKSILFIAVAMLIAFSAEAQTNKQVAGSKSMEVQFAPLGGNPISISGIKFRSFTTETSAFRANVFLGYNSTSTPTAASTDTLELNDRTSNFNLVLRPGLEWHLVGTDKLSPYYGAELLIGLSSNGTKNDVYDGDDVQEITTSQMDLSFGANAVAGVDYYFAQNIFLGAEFGFGFQLTSEGDKTTSSTFEGADDVVEVNGGSFNVGPTALGQIRLGIIF